MNRAIVIALLLGAVACRKPTRTQAEEIAAQPQPRVDASALIEKFECARCHEIPNVQPAPHAKHCVHCHREIHDGTFELADEEAHERWRGHIHSLRWVPTLAAADRLRADWIRDFLLKPHDIRPDLVAEMPRLEITREEATQIATHLTQDVPTSSDAPSDSFSIGRGEELYRHLGCARCHRFTGSRVDDPAITRAGSPAFVPEPVAPRHDAALGVSRDIDESIPNGGSYRTAPPRRIGSDSPLPRAIQDRITANNELGSWALAPDLRFARDRMTTTSLATWIASPRGSMPSQHVKPDDAKDNAAFIATTPLAALPAPSPNGRLPLLTRDVSYDEVEERVFKKVCWHCHATADYAMGDGGPGNTGGFGFRAHELDLSTYENTMSGATGDDGTTHSIFAKTADGMPLLVAHLIARHTEENGDIVDGIRGMPLGLPPMSWEDIQLVESWIAQGRQR